MFEEEERNNKKGAKANTGSAAKPIVNHQIDSDEAVLKIHLEKKVTMISTCNNDETLIQGVPKKCTNRMLLEPKCTGSNTSVLQWLAPFGPKKCFFGRFLLRLSRIKRSQVILMVKFTPQHSILVMILFY